MMTALPLRKLTFHTEYQDLWQWKEKTVLSHCLHTHTHTHTHANTMTLSTCSLKKYDQITR